MPKPAALPGKPLVCLGDAGGAPPASEVRGIREDRQIRLFGSRGRQELPVFPVDPWNVGDHFEEPTTAKLDESTTVRTPAARRWDPCSRRIDVRRECAQLAGHQRSVEVAGCLARRDEDLAAHTT